MKHLFGITLLCFVTVAGFCQSSPGPQHNTVQWLNIDKFCGTLTLVTPIEKTIKTLDGKTEKRLYENVLKDAEITLYKGTPSDKRCCGTKIDDRRTRSDKFGSFELLGLESGWYWARIKNNDFSTTIPLHVMNNSNDKSCHDPSVGHIFILDSQPPKVETRVY